MYLLLLCFVMTPTELLIQYSALCLKARVNGYQCDVGWWWVSVLVQVSLCEKKKSSLLLVAAVISVKALHQEGHQIANRRSITGSHHILTNTLRLLDVSHLSCFLWAACEQEAFELPSCSTPRSRIIQVLQKLTATIFQKQKVSLRPSFPSSSVFSSLHPLATNGLFPLPQIDGWTSSWCYVCTY